MQKKKKKNFFFFFFFFNFILKICTGWTVYENIFFSFFLSSYIQ